MRSFISMVALVGACSFATSALAQDISGFEARSFQGTKLTLPYRLFKVKNPVAGSKYPLILFLHGAGERGDDNGKQLMANAGATVWATDAHQAAHPAYVIAPQCPADKQWVDTDWTKGSYSTTTVAISDQLTTALEIADAVAKEFDTDPARQYITGLSMGGYGTWDAILRNPERFAAALPVCGAGDPSKAELIKDLPIWTAHGDADPVVPVTGSRDMVAALKAVGSTIKYSEYPGVQHDAWTMTYANEEIVDWLFTNKKDLPAGMGGSGGSGGNATAGTANAGTDAGGSASGGAGTGGNGLGVGGSATAGTTSGDTSSNSAGSAPAGAGTSTSSAGATSTPSGDDGGCSIAGTQPSTSPLVSFGLLTLVGVGLSRRRRAA
ncbi:MAG TPA: prolyl oligopeptidase family serine peptidase [Polyangiaceae bacterium]|nr:prolyl oligopeptidase family serine peptidase [Polyangiaceae bacterium]